MAAKYFLSHPARLAQPILAQLLRVRGDKIDKVSQKTTRTTVMETKTGKILLQNQNMIKKRKSMTKAGQEVSKPGTVP